MFGQDRCTVLSEHLLHELRAYWIEYKPKQWLFPGQKAIEKTTIYLHLVPARYVQLKSPLDLMDEAKEG